MFPESFLKRLSGMANVKFIEGSRIQDVKKATILNKKTPTSVRVGY